MDFEVEGEVVCLLWKGEFGRYGGEKGEMKVWFMWNKDIRGGNWGRWGWYLGAC